MVPLYPFPALFAGAADPTPFFYLCRTETKGTGLLCSISLANLPPQAILCHEQTYDERSEALFQEFSRSHLQCNPILLITENENLKTIIQEMEAVAILVDERVTDEYSLWRVPKNYLLELKGPLCIADGHHRFSAFLKYHSNIKNSSKIMVAIFCVDQVATRSKALVINKTDLNGEALKEKLKKFFHIVPLQNPKNPENKTEFGMRLGKYWYHLVLKPFFSDHQENRHLLGIEIFKKFVLQNTLNLENYASSSNIKVLFEKCSVSALLHNLKNESSMGFIIGSDSSESVINIAKEGRLLEANSTYFEPKFMHGLVCLTI